MRNSRAFGLALMMGALWAGAAAATTATFVVDASTKRVSNAPAVIAVRETVTCIVSNAADASSAGLVLRILNQTNTLALATNFVASGSNHVGTLNLNTSNLVAYFAMQEADVNDVLMLDVALWDTVNNWLLLNDRLYVINNPYVEGMPGPHPIASECLSSNEVAAIMAAHVVTVDGLTITGSGTPGDPLVSVAAGDDQTAAEVAIDDSVFSLILNNITNLQTALYLLDIHTHDRTGLTGFGTLAATDEPGTAFLGYARRGTMIGEGGTWVGLRALATQDVVTVDGVTITGSGTTGDPLVSAAGGDDQTASEVSFAPTGTVTATDVQAAIAELDSEKVSTTDARYLAALTNTPTLQQVVTAGGGATNVGTLTGIVDLVATRRYAIGGGISVANIDSSSFGSGQCGGNDGTQRIGEYAYGALQSGHNVGAIEIGDGASGARQYGYVDTGASATNRGRGAIQLLDLDPGQKALTTTGGDGSLLLGAGTANHKYAVVAGDDMVSYDEGSVTAKSGFWHGTTNITDIINALAAALDISADRTPYMLAYASTVTVSRANGDLQQLHPITGPCTIVFPVGVTNYASCIDLVIPPVGTQTVALATGPTYYYGDSLTGPSTTNYTHALWQTVYGTTGTTVRLYRGEAQ